MNPALGGLRVLDLADRSGALAGRVLADLGAEVILVEPPNGNPIRALAPWLEDRAGLERSCAHLYFSANKRSIVVDPAADETTFARLVASADVLIDTARPGTRDVVDHARLAGWNPDLIQLSITPFGLDDVAGRRGNDLIAGAAGGLVGVSGQRRGVPVQGGASPAYCLAGLAGAAAVTIALTARDAARRRGEAPASCHVDLSLQEAAATAVAQTANATHWAWHRRIPTRPGLSSALRCRDGGHVGLLVRPDRFPAFLAWLDAVGIPHSMTEDDWRWSRLDAPRKDNPVSDAILALTAALPRDEFVAGALEADIVCLPVLDFEDIARHEQFLANDQFLDVEHEVLGVHTGFLRSPVDGMGEGVSIRRAPTLGEHTGAVLAALPKTPIAPSSPRVATVDPARALEGLSVVDFSWVLAGPLGTRSLASFGADVVRIESSRKPDSMRSQLGPDGTPDPDLGGLYNTVNAGKKSFAVDLTTERGRALVKRLIADADVVTSNFRPGALERMGLGYETLREIKPDVILLNLPGAHPKGPWAVRASMGNILMSASGFNMLTGFPEEPPRGIGVAYPDFLSPHLLVASVLAAVRHRDRTGAGQEITAVQLSTTLSLLGAEWMHYRSTGQVPARNANRDPNAAPHGVYPAAGEDRWIALAATDEAEWDAFCRTIGEPGLVDDPRFASLEARKANEDGLDEIVRHWTTARDAWEASAALQAAGVPAAPVEDLRDMMERDPLLRSHYQIVRQPVAPDVDIPIDREVARFRGHEHALRRAPGMGEHTFEIATERLGLEPAEYASLLAEGVLE